ncbi:MAG: tetratricopeptide repeat protein [Chloroflexota bacterium]|nr:MAG: tetratricopeptide repeat protein [Chloroflexota bacterium]
MSQPLTATDPYKQTLSDYEFERYRALVEERFGLHFSENRRSELERGILQAFAASTCATHDEFFRLLQDPANRDMYLETLANTLTICESYFFRDEPQMDALYNHVLPEIISRRSTLRAIRIWSAGCASGEEPYSIAIFLRELIPDVDNWSITILATDINTQALDRARQANYGDWAFREERGRQLRGRYFRHQGNRYALVPEVRKMVTFSHLNLAEGDYPSFATNTTFMDLILCRNVTIYFPEPVTRMVIERLYQSQIDGGWLAVGYSEPSVYLYQHYQVRNFPNTIMYQRVAQPVPVSQPATTHTSPPPAVWKTTAPKPEPAPLKAKELPRQEKKDSIDQARELIEAGNSVQARDLLVKALEAKPHSAVAASLLGQVYANLGEWEKAERWCQKAIRLQKLNIDAYYTLGLVEQHRGQLDQAIEAMKKVIYIDRQFILGHFHLAHLYHSRGQLPSALKSLDNARALLNGLTNDTVIPGSEGITAGSMREGIIRLLQRWSGETV